MSIKFTVFTPTYNRAHTLVGCYQALCRQTVKDFVWLIVDDGSTDNTKELVYGWMEKDIVKIEYLFQNNAGKQRAVNTAVENCSTEYFGFLDSDDLYCDNTIERFLADFEQVKYNKNVAGVLARRGTDKSSPLGSTDLPSGKYIKNFDYLIKKYNYYGDTCRAYYTSILREYKYPVICDKFIPEDVMLSAIDQKYDLLIVNEVYSISGYLKDGYTRNGYRLFHRNPHGFALGMGQIASANRGILRTVKYTIMLSVWCRKKRLLHPSRFTKRKILLFSLIPISYMAYLLRRPRWYFEEYK